MKQKNERSLGKNEDVTCQPSSNWEKIYVCTRNPNKTTDDEAMQNILLDFKRLDIVNNPCNDSSDDIKNEGKEANLFDKISKYYGRKKNVFLFKAMLENEESVNKIVSLISEMCDSTAQKNFIKRVQIYLERKKQGETNAKEILNSEFPGAFFSGYPQNVYENLNVNFTKCSQSLEISRIFHKKWEGVDETKNETKRVKVYDNGKRVVTILKKSEQMLNYSFNGDSSCQLVVCRILGGEKYTMFIDINSNEIIHFELEINDSKTDPLKALKLPASNEVIHIKDKNLIQVLQNYFTEDAKIEHTLCPENECLPIKTLEDLKTWCPPSMKPFTAKLTKRKEMKHQPKTLICHDMKGGYLDDRFVESVCWKDPYFFVHWSGIDMFVYFSHHLVTIPPLGWISAAHKNGVKVLGTFITEWNDGAKVCEEVFDNEKTTRQLCKQLVNIALHYNFDGWLINIENPIKACKISMLKKFVKWVTDMMHMACPGSQVIWYDSVIKNGELKWQNELNTFNRMFFHGCDGIFLNYNWTDKHLNQSVVEAGSRQTDVYVGVDVFGRGCLGGGGFSTNIAVSEARKFGLSVAIFAPGWVYECLKVEDFNENQFKFWNYLEEYLPPRILDGLPFISSFCPGFGNKMFRDGKIISDKVWYNLSLQHPQPIYKTQAIENTGSVSLYTEEGFNGGGCVILSGKFYSASEPLSFEILQTSFHLKSTCNIEFVFKPLLPNSEITLALSNSSDQEEDYTLNLIEYGKSQTLKHDSISTKYINAISIDVAVENDCKSKDVWTRRQFVLPFERFADHVIRKVSISLVSTDYEKDSKASVLIGELKILLQENDTLPEF